MRTPVIIFLAGLLLTACGGPDQTALHQQIAGTWTPPNPKDGAMTFYTNGSFQSKWVDPRDTVTYLGKWDTSGGYFIMTVTNARSLHNTNVETAGSVDRFRLIQVDGKRLILDMGGFTNVFVRQH